MINKRVLLCVLILVLIVVVLKVVWVPKKVIREHRVIPGQQKEAK